MVILVGKIMGWENTPNIPIQKPYYLVLSDLSCFVLFFDFSLEMHETSTKHRNLTIFGAIHREHSS